MQDKELFKEFVEFCENKPKYEVLNHSSWSTCAVGEFAISKGISVDEVVDIRGSEIDLELDNFVGKVLGEKPSEDVSNYPYVMRILCECRLNEHKDYGQLTSFLKEFL